LKIRNLVPCVFILVSVIVNTACVYVNLNTTPTPVPSTTPSPMNPDFVLPPTTGAEALPVIPDFVSVIASIRPSVVAINTQVPALDIFGGTFSQEGAGSGWIIDTSGLIVTNNHVVEGASSITITLEDGRNFPADLVRSDSISDLAVVKINAVDLQAAKIGNSSKLRVGDWVVAIGNSLGKGISATKGIVGALGVSISVEIGQTLYGLIQTDAAINPGNSGGPLVNLLGEVVGITSIKVAQVGVEGVGYAISTHEALPIIDDLVKTGYVIRPWLGASLYNVDRIVVLRYGLAVDQGVLVTQTAVGSPIDIAGIHAGDVITAVSGKEVANIDDFNTLIHTYNIGQQVDITFYRGSVKSAVSVTLAPSPPPAIPLR
jgi:serine protease Do